MSTLAELTEYDEDNFEWWGSVHHLANVIHAKLLEDPFGNADFGYALLIARAIKEASY